jgi:hypothetical protein
LDVTVANVDEHSFVMEQDERPVEEKPLNRNAVYDLPDPELVARLRKWYLEDLRAAKDERANRKKDWRMWSGDQYEQDARDRAKAENRPLLTLNYILPTICAIEGEERSNRQQIKVYGFDDADDDKGAYAFNLLIRGVMNENNGEYSVSSPRSATRPSAAPDGCTRTWTIGPTPRA